MTVINKVKRKLEFLNPQTNRYDLIFNDYFPMTIGDVVLDDDEDMQNISYNLFKAVTIGLSKGTYRFSLDTLGDQEISCVTYKVEIKTYISVIP